MSEISTNRDFFTTALFHRSINRTINCPIKSAISPIIIVGFSVLLLACSAAPSTELATRLPTDAEVAQYNASVPAEKHIICRQETPIRSNIPMRVCRLVKDVEESSTFHREQLRRALF